MIKQDKQRFKDADRWRKKEANTLIYTQKWGGGSERISGEQDRVIDREGGVIDLYSAHTSGLFSLADLWLVTHN